VAVKFPVKHSDRLVILNLRTNDLGLEGTKALAAVAWPSLSFLHLGSNALNKECAAALAKTRMPALRRLVLVDNEIEEAGGDALAGADWNHSLTI
jgi:hypothetical protein